MDLEILAASDISSRYIVQDTPHAVASSPQRTRVNHLINISAKIIGVGIPCL